jgi:hypothetical protein
MRSPLRFAGIITVIVAVCGPAWAQEIAPADSGVSIHKQVTESGSTHTVKYFVTGGSPKLQALVRRIEWTENELSVVEQMQGLKLDTVAYERRATAVRTSQLTNPYFPPGFLPPPVGTAYGCDDLSSLQKALAGQLAYEATPQAALQLIDFLEKQQTELDKELKALPPKEKKAAQGPIDALRPKLAALTRSNPPQPQPAAQPAAPVAVAPKAPVTEPAAAPQDTLSALAALQQAAMPLDPIAFKPIEVQWGQSWWPAEVLQMNGDKYRIHYTGYDASWDEWVTKDRIRSSQIATKVAVRTAAQPVVNPPVVLPQVTLPAPAAPQQLPKPPDPVASAQSDGSSFNSPLAVGALQFASLGGVLALAHRWSPWG